MALRLRLPACEGGRRHGTRPRGSLQGRFKTLLGRYIGCHHLHPTRTQAGYGPSSAPAPINPDFRHDAVVALR